MAAGLPPDPPLDTSIARGQAGLREDAEVVHGTLALLREAAGKTVAELAADDAFTGAFAPRVPDQTITYTAGGDVDTVTDVVGGSTIVTTYTYNADGTVATDSTVIDGGTPVVRTYGYTGDNLTSIEVA